MSQFSRFIQAHKHGADEQQAEQALIDGSTEISRLRTSRTPTPATNRPIGASVTDDMASADFWSDYVPATVRFVAVLVPVGASSMRMIRLAVSEDTNAADPGARAPVLIERRQSRPQTVTRSAMCGR